MISETLYAKYIKEREGLSILESELGFITYRISNKECFIVDMYVDSTSRLNGFGRSLLNRLIEIVDGCELITGNIWLWDQNANETLKAALAGGFTVKKANNDCLLIARDLKGA